MVFSRLSFDLIKTKKEFYSYFIPGKIIWLFFISVKETLSTIKEEIKNLP